MSNAELRAKAHEVMDKYLDAGGSFEFVIIAKGDIPHAYPNLEVSDGLLGNNSSDEPDLRNIL